MEPPTDFSFLYILSLSDSWLALILKGQLSLMLYLILLHFSVHLMKSSRPARLLHPHLLHQSQLDGGTHSTDGWRLLLCSTSTQTCFSVCNPAAVSVRVLLVSQVSVSLGVGDRGPFVTDQVQRGADQSLVFCSEAQTRSQLDAGGGGCFSRRSHTHAVKLPVTSDVVPVTTRESNLIRYPEFVCEQPEGRVSAGPTAERPPEASN